MQTSPLSPSLFTLRSSVRSSCVPLSSSFYRESDTEPNPRPLLLRSPSCKTRSPRATTHSQLSSLSGRNKVTRGKQEGMKRDETRRDETIHLTPKERRVREANETSAFAIGAIPDELTNNSVENMLLGIFREYNRNDFLERRTCSCHRVGIICG